jgi:hypothetical protein
LRKLTASHGAGTPAARRLDIQKRGSNIGGRTNGRATGAGKIRKAAMSFWSALFGGRTATTEPAAAPVEYKGYVIRPAPYKNDGGHFQTAGSIAREIGGVTKEHRFIRADAYISYDGAVTFTLNKARQIIDLQGERMFDA